MAELSSSWKNFIETGLKKISYKHSVTYSVVWGNKTQSVQTSNHLNTCKKQHIIEIVI